MIKIYPFNHLTKEDIYIDCNDAVRYKTRTKIRDIMGHENLLVIKENIKSLLFTCWRKSSKNNQ